MLSYLLNVISAGQCRAFDWRERRVHRAGDQGQSRTRRGSLARTRACVLTPLTHRAHTQQTQTQAARGQDFETNLGIRTYLMHTLPLEPLLSILKWCREEKKAYVNFYVCCLFQYCQRDLTPVTWHRGLAQARQTRHGSECGMRGTGQGKTDQKKIDVINHQDHENLPFHHTAMLEYPNSHCR